MSNESSVGPCRTTAATVCLAAACSGLLSGCAATASRGVHSIVITRDLPYPAPYVFKRVFEDFAGVEKFHPHAVSSGYIEQPIHPGPPEVGQARFVSFEEDNAKVAFERLVAYDPQLMRMRFHIYKTIGLPLDTEATYGTSWLEPISPNRTRFHMRFDYRTSPRFLAWFAHNGIQNDLNDMAAGIEDYLAREARLVQDGSVKVEHPFPDADAGEGRNKQPQTESRL